MLLNAHAPHLNIDIFSFILDIEDVTNYVMKNCLNSYTDAEQKAIKLLIKNIEYCH